MTAKMEGLRETTAKIEGLSEDSYDGRIEGDDS